MSVVFVLYCSVELVDAGTLTAVSMWSLSIYKYSTFKNAL